MACNWGSLGVLIEADFEASRAFETKPPTAASLGVRIDDLSWQPTQLTGAKWKVEVLAIRLIERKVGHKTH